MRKNKLLFLLICSLLLVGCAKTETVKESTTQINTELTENKSDKYPYVVYFPDEEYLSFSCTTLTTSSKEEIPSKILEQLYDKKVLSEKVMINSFEVLDDMVKIDLSENFIKLVSSTGSTGEYYMVGCLVNSFIDTYNVEKVEILVNGNTFESGHVLYDAPLNKYE